MPDLVPDQTGAVQIDGQQIYYERFGTGARETVCLLNGLAMHTKAWYGFVPLLADEFDVLLWDYLGQGNSSQEDVPYSIPRLCDALTTIVDALAIPRFHLMGISYGGFVGLEYARLYQERLLTLTVSGILLTHERLFQMYEDISLLFYRGSPEIFEMYTHYMYEKIFGEAFVLKVQDNLAVMRDRFYERFKDKRHCLIRLTEAQNRLFAALDGHLPGYRAIRTPTLIMAGAEDRAIPPWVQQKLTGILPHSRYEVVQDSGHCVYIEQPAVFFGNIKRFAKTRSLAFEALSR